MSSATCVARTSGVGVSAGRVVAVTVGVGARLSPFCRPNHMQLTPSKKKSAVSTLMVMMAEALSERRGGGCENDMWFHGQTSERRLPLQPHAVILATVVVGHQNSVFIPAADLGASVSCSGRRSDPACVANLPFSPGMSIMRVSDGVRRVTDEVASRGYPCGAISCPPMTEGHLELGHEGCRTTTRATVYARRVTLKFCGPSEISGGGFGPAEEVEVVIYVASHCFNCGYAQEIAALIRREYPTVKLSVVDVAEPQAKVPEQVFATPTYLLNGKLWSLGNPSPEQVRMKLGQVEQTL